MKTCNKCDQCKPRDDFYRHPMMRDGFLGHCKECHKAGVAARYKSTRHAHSLYEHKRFKDPARKAKVAEYQRRYRARHPDRYAARTAVMNAIRDGRLFRQPCRACGEPKAQAHHENYAYPLDVIWECFKCHREIEHGQTVVSDFGTTKAEAA